MRRLIIALSVSLCVCTSAVAEKSYLFQWDDGEGTDMPGWTWYNEGNTKITSGHPGWILNTNGPFGGSQTFPWGDSVRTFELGGYGSNNLAEIVTTDRAPSTSTGGALRVYENPDTLNTAAHLTTWWIWYDGMPLSDRGLTDSTTDRFSFYIKTSGTNTATSTESGATFHVGTYLTDDTACSSYNTGAGSPYEGPGNQHYYHYLRLSPGAWLHVELDRHPTHRRNSFVAGDDPAFIQPADDACDPVVSHPMHYYEHLGQWYMEIRYEQAQETSYLLDEMYFYSTQDPTESAEPNQNDDSVTSVWVGYWPENGKWQMGWNDMSYMDANGSNTNDNTQSTFEIRWSTNPITNVNYNSATVVEPEWFTSPTHTSYPNGVRRWDSWDVRVFTQFDLPNNVESNNSVIYFAIKDVSVAGGNGGTNWPYNRSDGHNAASPYIRTIDYSISNVVASTPVIVNIKLVE
jgi:hypothetical protein